ncbi:MAG: hypothetical protein Q9218_004366 [Villophora microphyllina]
MLSRGNSEASARLRRAKSSAAIKTQRSYLESRIPDPLLGKEQALAAAHHAFGRASGSEVSSRPSSEAALQSRPGPYEPLLTRSKSIRFAGPAALPRRELPITMRAAPAAHHIYDSRRQSLHPKLRRHHSFVHGDDSAMTALPAHAEDVETQVASQPSSFRRLRKSRSMFIPQGTSLFPAPRSWSSQKRTPTDVTINNPDQQRVHSTSRMGQSFSFLRPNTERGPPTAASSKAPQSEAVGLARDQYIRQLEQQRTGQQLALEDTATRRRPQKVFRKSVRTSSGASHDSAADPTTSPRGKRIERKGIGGRARDLSSSFKHRLKRVFNRPTETESTFPAQQLHATRQHFDDAAKSDSPQTSQPQPADSLYDITPDRGSPRQRDVLHILRKRASLVGSFKSSHGDGDADNDKSRVTSWADSTAANTVAIRQESGRKRLSIIRENGAAPVNLGSHTASGSTTHRRLSSSVTVPTFTSASSHQTYGTPRQVSNDLGQVQPTSPTGMVSAPTPMVNETTSDPQTPDNKRTTPQEEEATESSPKRPLRESRSMFFPQTTRIERTRTSPFRQVMQSSGRSQEPQPATGISSPLEGMDKAPYLSAPSRNRDRSLTRSESVYSRSSSGSTPQPFDSYTASAQLEKRAEDQVTTESVATRLRDGESPAAAPVMTSKEYSSAHRRGSMPGESLLSDTREPPKHPLEIIPTKKRTGHKREHAQIHEDDTDIGRLQSSTNEIKDPLASVPIGLIDRTRLRYISSQPMIDRFPLMSIKPQANANNIDRRPHVNPRASNLSATENENRHPNSRNSQSPSKLNVQSPGANIVSADSHPKDLSQQPNGSRNDRIGLHVSPRNSSRWAVSNATPRSSPERLARLRRMQSSNTLRSPVLRSAVDLSPMHREWTAIQDTNGPVVRTTAQGTILAQKENGRSPDSRRMVDTFLSKRGRPQSNVTEDTVFI